MDADHYEAVAAIVHRYANGGFSEADAIQEFRALLEEYRDETVPVYAVVVHPPDTTSYLANVYRSRETAAMVAEQQEAENAPGTTAAVEEYEVVA